MAQVATMDHQFHVLAVDDSIIDRKLIERLLKTSSYQVTVVDSGSKALEYLGLSSDENEGVEIDHSHVREIGINLIITDYSMPGMTGYDLLRKIKGSSSLKDIPVIIMSSENVPSRINRCLEEGAEEFFLKPVQQSDMNRIKPHLMREKRQKVTPNSLKRKAMVECISPEKTRKYNNLCGIFWQNICE
ncbi:two-component response regulator ORR3 isoform X2 [Nicotiana tabacum]|uniref:Two-component response regulator ORR10 isoform X2 n=2 Tax=Nicotiana TaxID=4085 RepID=A0A1S3ZSC4_TOBAC|nr:PREDICTED: two-component response regulator ARR9-like isoform X1 [Nicotiana sylvestris]XP_016467249.1 PREDICTED: two-component response regulator ORR10-like isoform X2 [Nicotiana tabacum]